MTAIASNRANLDADENTENLIKVMIVDDSVVVRGLVSRWVKEEPGMVAIGKCSNGQIAIQEAADLLPDVIILDIEIPVMNGIDALPKILEAVPGVKVIMASTLTQRNAEISLNALSLGAADYIPKPVNNSGVTTSVEFRTDLLAKIRAFGKNHKVQSVQLDKPILNKARLERIKSKSLETTQSSTAKPAVEATRIVDSGENFALRPFSSQMPKILVIGSSTGGPPALLTIFNELGPSLKNIPVLVTQHMPSTFTTIFAEHLGKSALMDAHEGVDGEQISPGKIYVAPGGKHMMVEKKGAFPFIKITDGPEINFCKPAVDPLFQTVAECYGASALTLVLTGMGSDGSQGAVTVADKGGTVIAQDKETSVVWGMPGATAKAGACSSILPLNKIAPKLKELITGRV